MSSCAFQHVWSAPASRGAPAGRASVPSGLRHTDARPAGAPQDLRALQTCCRALALIYIQFLMSTAVTKLPAAATGGSTRFFHYKGKDGNG